MTTRDGEAKHEDAIPGKVDIRDHPVPAQEGGAADLDVVRAENQPEELLHDERDAPGREQAFQRPAVEKPDDAALQGQADEGRAQKGDG